MDAVIEACQRKLGEGFSHFKEGSCVGYGATGIEVRNQKRVRKGGVSEEITMRDIYIKMIVRKGKEKKRKEK